MKHIIGINGFKGSGKGTVGNLIAASYPGRVKQVGFSDKLKVLCAKALGYEGSDAQLIAWADEFKETGVIYSWATLDRRCRKTVSGRRHLQNYGQNCREMFGDDFWVNQVLPAPLTTLGLHVLYGGLHPDTDCLVLTDLRYPNEAQRVKDLGGQVWLIERPGLSSDGHISEQRLPSELIDHVIVNSGDFIDLEYMVTAAVDKL